MKNNWQTKELGNVLEYEQPTPYIVSSKNYKEKYETPVLTAGKSFILGKTKEKNGIFPKNKLPVIIFDDFTTATKFVDFPFKVKSSAMKILHPVKNISDAKFLFYLIQTINFNYKGIHKRYWISEYSKIEILLPPLPEQHHIVKILDETFEKIGKAKENAAKNLQNSKEILDSYLHNIFTNSNNKEFKKLSEVAEYFNGLTYSPKNVSSDGIIVLRSSNVQNDELDFSDIVRVNLVVKDKIIVQDGDILMCSRNGSKRLVGKTATIKNLTEKMTFGTFMMVIRSQYNPYLAWFFKSIYFRKQISGGENTMINQITRYMLDDITLYFPPIKVQNEIVKKLSALSAETKKLESIYKQKLADLEELKKSILKKAFNGEL
jgi:restriction endonuclease S subunit